MREGKVFSKIFGIALVFAMIGGLPIAANAEAAIPISNSPTQMPSSSEPYDLGPLSDDLENLPEYQDGVSTKEEEAIEQICLLTKSNDPEVKKGLSLIEKYGVPKTTIFGNSDGIPNYNTQLEVLLWLAENNTINKDYGRVALGLSLHYGSVVTIGDEEVDVKVRDYVSQFYSYIKDTDRVLEQKELSWRARDYPLEAIIGLVWGANNLRYPYFYEDEGDPQGKPWQHYWRNEFKDRQMNSEDFDWLFVSPDNLQEMREWAFNEHFVHSDISETANRLDTKLGSWLYYMTDRPDVPPSYFEVEGKITPGCRISNPDWQWEYFKEKGKIVGNCEDVRFADSIFLKSLNMAPFGGHVNSEGFGHCVILYYAPQNHSLRTTARQLDIIEGQAEGLITYRISRLPWDNFYNDEDIYAFEVISPDKKLLETGIDIQEALSMDSGLLLTYKLSLQEDASNRPHMYLRVRNIKSGSLRMVINGTIMDGCRNVYDLFDITSNLSVKDLTGNTLPVDSSKTTIVPDNWYLSFFRNYPIHYDVINIDTKGNSELIVEYDIISSTEMWSGFGADSSSLFDDPRDFWAGYLEWMLYRPSEHEDVCSAKLTIELPSGWRYATVYPNLGNEVDLERMDYMYGDNVRWKNYQRSNFILFKEGPFILASKVVRGVKVQDIYSAQFTHRNHQAQYQYFQYLCDNIGPLPVYAVLTFYPSVNGHAIRYLRVYQEGPYGSSHGLMGEYFGTGGDIGDPPDDSLPQVQVWDFNSAGKDKSYSFPMHGTVRYWICHFIQLKTLDEEWFKGGFCTYYENMSVASRYGLDEVIERRFRPMYQYYMDNIAGPPEVDQVNFTNHSFLTHFKPALTAFYIDKLLIEHSGGVKDINDLMRLLFEDALAGLPLSRESFLENLNSLTDYDFASVVDDYLYGDKKLNLDKWLLEEAGPWSYDEDDNGYIEIDELLDAIDDYIGGVTDISLLLDVMSHYINETPV